MNSKQNEDIYTHENDNDNGVVFGYTSWGYNNIKQQAAEASTHHHHQPQQQQWQ